MSATYNQSTEVQTLSASQLVLYRRGMNENRQEEKKKEEERQRNSTGKKEEMKGKGRKEIKTVGRGK